MTRAESPLQEAAQPSLEEIDAALAKLEPALVKHAKDRRLYNAAQAEWRKAKTKAAKAPHEAEKAKHLEGYRAYRKADNERRALRKQRAELYPDAG